MRNRTKRDDARAARICQVIARSMSGKHYPLEDFMPQDTPGIEAKSDDQMAAKLDYVMGQIGGKSKGVVSLREATPEETAFRERMLRFAEDN